MCLPISQNNLQGQPNINSKINKAEINPPVTEADVTNQQPKPDFNNQNSEFKNTSNVNTQSSGVPVYSFIGPFDDSTPPKGVTQEEIDWAVQINKEVNDGKRIPTQDELIKFDDITMRREPVTHAEIEWANDFLKVIGENKTPALEDYARYFDISARYQHQFGNQNPPEIYPEVEVQQPVSAIGGPLVSEKDIKWALSLEDKVNSHNHIPSKPEKKKYENIFNKLKLQGLYYSDRAISQFKEVYKGEITGNKIPYLKPEKAEQVAKDLGGKDVKDLQKTTGSTVDGKFGPETFLKSKENVFGEINDDLSTGELNIEKLNKKLKQLGVDPITTVTQEEMSKAIETYKKTISGKPLSEGEETDYNNAAGKWAKEVGEMQ
jgi:hypothetical protein